MDKKCLVFVWYLYLIFLKCLFNLKYFVLFYLCEDVVIERERIIVFLWYGEVCILMV